RAARSASRAASCAAPAPGDLAASPTRPARPRSSSAGGRTRPPGRRDPGAPAPASRGAAPRRGPPPRPRRRTAPAAAPARRDAGGGRRRGRRRRGHRLRLPSTAPPPSPPPTAAADADCARLLLLRGGRRVHPRLLHALLALEHGDLGLLVRFFLGDLGGGAL